MGPSYCLGHTWNYATEMNNCEIVHRGSSSIEGFEAVRPAGPHNHHCRGRHQPQKGDRIQSICECPTRNEWSTLEDETDRHQHVSHCGKR